LVPARLAEYAAAPAAAPIASPLRVEFHVANPADEIRRDGEPHADLAPIEPSVQIQVVDWFT
jgi:hypothetical protein